MGKVAEVVFKDFAGAAGSFFGNARIPASIVLGSSLGALFALNKFGSVERKPIELFLVKLYRISTWCSFVLSLNTVITCTIASTIVLHGRFDPMAETAYLMLKREFDYEFTTVRWSITTALLLFIAIVTIRLVLEFELLSRSDRKDTAKFVIFSAVALTAHIMSYINTTLYCWSNYGEMTIYLLQLILRKTMNEPSVMSLLSIISVGLSTFYGLKSVLSTSGSMNKGEPPLTIPKDKGE